MTGCHPGCKEHLISQKKRFVEAHSKDLMIKDKLWRRTKGNECPKDELTGEYMIKIISSQTA
jgi:hypothetical protein